MVIQGKRLILILRLVFIGAALLAIAGYLGRDKIRELLLPEGAKIYASAEGRYSLVVPKNWNLDVSRLAFPVDALIYADRSAFLYIDSYDDPALAQDEGRFFLEQQIQKGFRENPNYALEKFEDTKWMGRRAFVMNGTRKDKETSWNFWQYVVFSNNDGRTYNITVSVKSVASQELKEEALAITKSFKFQ